MKIKRLTWSADIQLSAHDTEQDRELTGAGLLTRAAIWQHRHSPPHAYWVDLPPQKMPGRLSRANYTTEMSHNQIEITCAGDGFHCLRKYQEQVCLFASCHSSALPEARRLGQAPACYIYHREATFDVEQSTWADMTNVVDVLHSLQKPRQQIQLLQEAMEEAQTPK